MKERSTLSLLFFIRRTRLNKNGEAPIQMRITVNGVRADIAVKKFILPKDWSTPKGQALPKNRMCKEINMYLDSIKMRLIQIQREMEVDGIHVTSELLLNRYLGKDAKERKKLIELFREHNDRCRKLLGLNMAAATVQRYETSLKHTVDFMKFAYQKDEIYLDEIDHKFIVDYEFYLKSERKCVHNTTMKYLKNFRKIIRIALQNEYILRDPFANIKFTLDEVERDFLEDTEIQAIIEKDLCIERLSQVRDAFLFSIFTGLAFSDLKGLKQEHLSTDNNGALWIRKRRQKTKNMCNIPLLDIPKQIIDRYKDHPTCVKTGSLLPVLSNVKMNAYLKEIADLCGITKNLTTHTARHSFATFMTI